MIIYFFGGVRADKRVVEYGGSLFKNFANNLNKKVS